MGQFEYRTPSFEQEQLWDLLQSPDLQCLYNTGFGISFNGIIVEDLLLKACHTVINRHESLRMVFSQEKEQLTPKIFKEAPFQYEVINYLSTRSQKPLKQIIKKLMQQAIKIPFNLEEDLLVRHIFIRYLPNQYGLIVIFHHIIVDGISLTLYWKDLLTIYSDLLSNKPFSTTVSPTYQDYVLHQRAQFKKEKLDKKFQFWKEKLMPLKPFNMYTDYPRHPAIPNIKTYEFNLPALLLEKLNHIAMQQKTTTYCILLSVFFLVMRCYSSEGDLVVLVPSSGYRSPKFHTVFGYFSIDLLIVLENQQNIMFKDLVSQVWRSTIKAFKNYAIDMDEICESLKLPSFFDQNPLGFVYQNFKFPSIQLKDVYTRVEWIEAGSDACDITLEVYQCLEDCPLIFKYNANYYNKKTIEKISNHWLCNLLKVSDNFDILVNFEKGIFCEL